MVDARCRAFTSSGAAGGSSRMWISGSVLAAFRIVRCAAAGQHQLAIEVALDDPVGAQHANGILQAVEARNLRDDSAAGIDSEARENIVDKIRFQIAVLVG